MLHRLQRGEQRGAIGRRAQIFQCDPREALGGELDFQQVQPAVSLAGSCGRDGGDAGLRQHDGLAEAVDVAVQRGAAGAVQRPAATAAAMRREHAGDAGVDGVAQADQLRLRPFGQQQPADQRGVAGGKQQDEQAYRQRWRWLAA